MGQIDDFLSGKTKEQNNISQPKGEIDRFLAEPSQEQEKGFLGHAQDIGTSLAKGVVAVPETIVGLADIPTGGRVGKFIEEKTPIQFKQTKEAMNEWHTDQYKAQQQKFNDAGADSDSLTDKVIEKGKVALQNPSMIFNTVVESVPSMGLGGAGSKALGAVTKLGTIARGAIGEGVVMAGQQAENIRYQTDDKLLTPEQSGLSVATGALGSLFGYAGGQVAKRFGFDDIETAMAAGRLNAGQVGGEIQRLPLKSIPKSIIAGALTEGLLEELPQSVSEQLLQNIALDKPLDEGLDSAIVMGTLAGMAMGGGMNTVSAPVNYVRNNRAYDEQQERSLGEYLRQSVAEDTPAFIEQQQRESDHIRAQRLAYRDNSTALAPLPNYGWEDVQQNAQSHRQPWQNYIYDSQHHLDTENQLGYTEPNGSRLYAPNEYPQSVDGANPTLTVDADGNVFTSADRGEVAQQDLSGVNRVRDISSISQEQDTGFFEPVGVAGLLGEPDTSFHVSSDGEISTPQQRLDEQQEKFDRKIRGESWVDATPIPNNDQSIQQLRQQKLSERMGINPNDGPMSSAAALAVDSGASPVVQDTTGLLEQGTQANANQENQSKASQSIHTDQPLTFGQKIADAHINNPELKPQLIQQEVVETGRTRNDVLQEVGRVVEDLRNGVAPVSTQENVSENVSENKSDSAVNTNTSSDTTVQNTVNNVSENVSPLVQHSQQIAQLEQQLIDTKPTFERNPIKKQIAELKNQQEQEASSQWQGMSPEQRQILANQIDTAPAVRNKLPTAEWDRIGPAVKQKLINAMGQSNVLNQQGNNNEVLQSDVNSIASAQADNATPNAINPQSNTTPASNSFQQYDDVARQYGRSVSHDGVILRSDGKSTNIRIQPIKGGVAFVDTHGKKVGSASDISGLEKFIEKSWGDKKSTVPSTQVDTSANEADQGIIRQQDVSKIQADTKARAFAIGVKDGIVKFPEGAEYGDYSIYSKDKDDARLIRFKKDGTYTVSDTDGESINTGAFNTSEPVADITRILNEEQAVFDKNVRLPEPKPKKTTARSVRDGIAKFEQTYPIEMNADDVKTIVASLSSKRMLNPIDGERTLYELLPRTNIVFNGRNITNGEQVVDILEKYGLAKKAEHDGWRFELTNKGLDFFYIIGGALHNDGHLAKKGKDGKQSKKATDDVVEESFDAKEQYEQLKRNGRNVSESDIQTTFGLRDIWGVASYIDEQTHLNRMYDQFLNLATILNIPVRAIGLNNSLEIVTYSASYGTSGKYETYNDEPPKITIHNERGDFIPHEWWHALDNYFGKQYSGKYDNFLSEKSNTTFKINSKNTTLLRREVFDAWKNVIDKISATGLFDRAIALSGTKEIGYKENYLEKMVEMSARSFETFFLAEFDRLDLTLENPYYVKELDFSKGIEFYSDGRPKQETDHRLNNEMYLTQSEQVEVNKAFRHLFDTIRHEETDKGVRLYSRKTPLKPDSERRGTSPLDTTFSSLSVVSATRRVLELFKHLKMPATIDSSTGRLRVGNRQGVRVDKVKGLDNHSFTVQVVDSFDSLPSAIQQDATYQGENGETKRYDVLGVWHKGTLYINAGDIQGNSSTQQTTFEMYEELILHEVIGHFGVQQVFGQEYKTKLQQLFNALGGLEGIRKIAKNNGVDMQQFENAYIQPYTQAAKEGIYTESDVQQALVGELFAFVAQNQIKRPIAIQKFKELIGYVRQWLRERGFANFLKRYNDADIMMFLAEARKAVTDQSYFSKYKNQEFSSKNDSDTPLYSRSTKSNSGSTIQQVRDVLIERFGKDTISELERQGKLEIIQDYSVEGAEGYYHNGKAVLIASNLTDKTIIPTFLHELGGHAGFQNMMSQKQYNDLMNQFNRLVEQRNPVALAAKLLAEREQGSKRQQLEYLPYLLTLSSTMEQRNVIQRNALQKLINNLVTYVKATLFDNFGINLNLNPNDMVALAERMIEKSLYNPENINSPLYSRTTNYNDITDRITNGIKSLPKTGDWLNKKGVDWLKIGLQLLSRRHLTEVYHKILPQLTTYNELAAQMDADKNDAAAKADNIVREWAKLKDEEKLANLMHDATLARIDAAKPYQNGDDRAKHTQLSKRFGDLSPEAQAMYIKARDAYSDHYKQVHEAIKQRIQRSELTSQKKADLMKQMDDNFFNGRIKGVYFPLARFGDYIVVVRNQNGEVESVSRAETNNEAEHLHAELIKKYPQFTVDDVKLDEEFNAQKDGVGRGFMSSLFDEVGNLGLEKKDQIEFEDTLNQLYLSSLPDLSWAKHGIHRKGTAGFSDDARRAFAQNMFSGANYLAKLRYGDRLAQQLDEMKTYSNEQFKKGIGYDQRSARRVIDEMNKRHDNLMNPKASPLSSFLTSVGFMYYLGLSPAAAIVNMSQTALVAYPLMGAKWGFDKAGIELYKASRDFKDGLKAGYKSPDFSSWESFKNTFGDMFNPEIAKMLNDDEKKAYFEAVNRGVIDVTQAHDLAGIAQGEDSKVMWHFRPAMRYASGMFHHAERFNREVTLIAAYRLARQHVNKDGSKATHEQAFEQAVDAVYKGHFDYSAGNRARFMQGNIAKVVLLFKQYAQNMIYTLVRNAHQSLYALEPKERTEARRALAGMLGMHALAAGALGLPIAGMLGTAAILIAKKSKLAAGAFAAAAAAVFFGAGDGDDEDPYALEVVIRNWLADTFGSTTANAIFGGVPRALTPVDISGRVGLNNLIIPDVQDGVEGADWAKAMQSALLGPVVGISTNAVKGMQEIQEGHYGRGIETMLPVVLKNAMKSYRYGSEGVLSKGNDVIHNQDVTGIELFSQAIGFSPADVRNSMEGRSAIFQYKNKLDDHRRGLMRKWVDARRDNDSDAMNKAWAEILEFNEKVREKNPSMRINRINLMQSYKANERRTRETGDGGVYLTKRQKGAEEQGWFAFGD